MTSATDATSLEELRWRYARAATRNPRACLLRVRLEPARGDPALTETIRRTRS
jgi:hypothetical protein